MQASIAQHMPGRLWRPLRRIVDWLHSYADRRGIGYDSFMERDRRLFQPSAWRWIAAIWLSVGLFDATQNVFVMRAEGMHHAWGRLFFFLIVSWLPSALTTPLVLRLGKQYPVWQWNRPLNLTLNLVACAGIGLIAAGWVALLDELLNPWAISPAPNHFVALLWQKFSNGLLSSVFLYAAVLLVSHLLDSRERLARQQMESARLSQQLSQAQLNALRRQIEPHFLFNTLNAIAGLVREERNDAAVSMIAGLSDFLRRVVNDSDRQQVALEEELDFTKKYLDIQKERFAERLQLSVDVPVDLLPAQVPSLILQPMVENAVNHGIAKRVQGGAIRITASRLNGTLTLSVSNEGPGLPAGWDNSSAGVGISNVRTRLTSLYGNASTFAMKNLESGGVEVSFSLPLIFPDSKE